MARLERPTQAYLGLVAFSLAGSLLSRLTGLDPGPIAPITAVLTLLAGVWAALGPWIAAAPAVCLLVLAIGAGSEIAGIYTGVPFGRYAYTDAWWPTVTLPGGHFFPLLLPFAWLLMAGASSAWLSERLQGPALPVAAGVLAAAIDLPMEPVMAGPLGYWRWLEPGPLPGGAPWMNVFGWFITTLVAAVILQRAGCGRQRCPGAGPVLLGHLGLVVGLGLIALLPGT